MMLFYDMESRDLARRATLKKVSSRGVATDTTVCSSRLGEALQVNKLTFIMRFRFRMAPWAPRAPSDRRAVLKKVASGKKINSSRILLSYG